MPETHWPQYFASVPKNRTDLLPHYARFLATLNPYMPDVITGVLEAVSETSFGIHPDPDPISLMKSFGISSANVWFVNWTLSA